jgi:diadenosine tetraphosphate (Ap4A) HIT family hydrolase
MDRSIMRDIDCPFCRKLADLDSRQGEEIVWRFPHSIAFLGLWQFYRGYCVLVSRRHAKELSELPDEVRRGYLDEMCLLAKAIEQAFRPHKLNYELLGNQVPHLHWHLFPRSADEQDRLSPVWLALHAAEGDPAARQRLTAAGQVDRPAAISALRQSLNSLDAPGGA